MRKFASHTTTMTDASAPKEPVMKRCISKLTISMAGVACALAAMSAPTLAQPDGVGGTIASKGTAAGTPACVGCHGAMGEGNAAAGFPRLAGLQLAYLAAQLDHFAAGTRQNAEMAPIAKQLTAAERQAVAAYYSSMAAALALDSPDVTSLQRSDRGAWLALRGDWEQSLPACVQCHGPGGMGVGATFPALAGQSKAYIEAQLHAFKTGTRPGGPFNLMTLAATRLSDADMRAVSSYFGAKRPTVVSSTTLKEKK